MNLQEYNECVDTFSDGIFRFILKNLGDYQEAENIVQNTFEKLWLRRENVEMTTAKPYLFKVAYNNMIDLIRKRQKFTSLDEVYESKASTTEYSDLTHWVHKALEKLPAQQKAAITLRDLEGYDYRSIGEITGMTESQVKVNIFRARKYVKEYLQKVEPSLK